MLQENTVNHFMGLYYRDQHHSSIADFLCHHIKMAEESDELFIQVHNNYDFCYGFWILMVYSYTLRKDIIDNDVLMCVTDVLLLFTVKVLVFD